MHPCDSVIEFFDFFFQFCIFLLQLLDSFHLIHNKPLSVKTAVSFCIFSIAYLFILYIGIWRKPANFLIRNECQPLALLHRIEKQVKEVQE